MSCPAPDRDSRVDTAAWATMNRVLPVSWASEVSELCRPAGQCTVWVVPRLDAVAGLGRSAGSVASSGSSANTVRQ
ncbi:hypothetical protein EES39_39915 [Streptomyces sp. ADI92-24]|nr:hypothetical protein EES39_39915 [Streptomyces sp. ADI92-24]